MGQVARVVMMREAHAPGEGEVGRVGRHVGREVPLGAVIGHIPSHTSPSHSSGTGLSLRVEQRLHSCTREEMFTKRCIATPCTLTIVVETVALHEVDDVEGVGGRGLHVGHTEVVPLYVPLAVEVRGQHQCVVVRASVECDSTAGIHGDRGVQ